MDEGVAPRALPTLIGLGPIRSGTTWVHEMLFGHSQVVTTRLKEVNFFNFHFDKGAEWYDAQFTPPTNGTRLRADISPFYLEDPATCERVAQTVPNPFLMVNLRSPYERVLSWYQKYKQEDYPITAILGIGSYARTEAFRTGLMADTMQEYINRFGRDRLILVDYDDLKRDPVGLAQRLQRQLGLDVQEPQSVTREVNASVRYRNEALRWFAHQIGPVVRKAAPNLFYSLKFGVLHDIVFAKQRIIGPSEGPKLEVIDSLKDAFEADITRLEAMLGLDLTAWRYEAQAEKLRARIAATEAEAAIARAPQPWWQGLPQRLAIEARTLWALAWEPKVPVRARLTALVIASYLIMPIDLIPNSIPVIGHLDEAGSIPLAIALFLWMSPPHLVSRHRDLVRQAMGLRTIA
jgi:uncharacterized membrane protein YkvA (DUF1232 family)